MKVIEAIDLIEAWGARHAENYKIVRSLRAMSVGARQEDVRHFLPSIIRESRACEAYARHMVDKDPHCTVPDLCKGHGHCASQMVEHAVLSAVGMVLACFEASGPELKSVEWPSDDNIHEWCRALAEENGVRCGHLPPLKILDLSGKSPAEAADQLREIIREKQIDEAKAKTSIN